MMNKKGKKSQFKKICPRLFVVLCVIIVILGIFLIGLCMRPYYKEEYVECIDNLTAISLQNKNLRLDINKLESEKELLKKDLIGYEVGLKQIIILNESLKKCRDSLENTTEEKKKCEEEVSNLESKKFHLFWQSFVSVKVIKFSIVFFLIIFPINFIFKIFIKTKKGWAVTVLVILLSLIEFIVWAIILWSILSS